MLIGQALSPDGTMIVFDTNNRSEVSRSPEKVFIFDLESGEILSLNLLAYPRSGVFWSNDATSLLYIAKYGDEALDQLVVYDVLTGENQVLTERKEIILTSGWSIDNETVAFVTKVDGQYDLFTVNSKTLAQEQLTDNPDIETLVLWSPTTPQLLIGTTLDERSAFESWPWGVENLYVFTPSNNDWHLLLEITLGSESVSWSPDGRQIAFSNAGLLCIKNVETMAENCPLEDIKPYNEYFAAFLEPPVWSGDAKWLAFRAFDGRCDLVYFLALETNLVTSADFDCGSFSSLGPIYWSSAHLPERSD
jgi:Tol biopolymer transport system component